MAKRKDTPVNFTERFIAAALSVLAWFNSLFGFSFGRPVRVDMDKFELVWSDEFNGDAVSADNWRGYVANGKTMVRKGGYWNSEMATVADGNLTIRTEYLDAGPDGGPSGLYSYGMMTRGLYEQKYGYFECRCILPKGRQLWSAFWLSSPGMNDETDGGVNGAEIDVFESMYYWSLKKNRVSSNIHVDGYGDALKSMGSRRFAVKGDPYKEFNAYGFEWNEDTYTFYINGVKTFSADWCGVSAVPEYLLLSVEVRGKDGAPLMDSLKGVDRSEFVVDYVRAYQYK